ncbi:MAG: DNA mismatch repair protein [Chitinophaga sp.]|uniref:MutS-related protein n=1 Tax=Chitinophaga sp. TaxID=1869181 RepID=UPI001B18C572|nr:DNA mismatch repair protein [Chitinophaga sp.]MBO9728523.1 DNA mismatch repair protein [Chitinophaga sp.]
MILETDSQTMEDLGIFGRREKSGICDLYNHTHTRGGEAVLQEMFRNPLASQEAINRRSSIIESFARLHIPFPFDAGALDMAEKYLTSADERARHRQSPLSEKEIVNGVTAIIELMQRIKSFITTNGVSNINAYMEELNAIALLLENPAFEPVFREGAKGKLSYGAVAAYDTLFRISERSSVTQLLAHIYNMDVYLSVAKVATERNFIFPKALEKGGGTLCLEGVYHPELKQPIANNLFLGDGQNQVFLTGANMAGKSTFLRAVSTALYVAHMGFPVAAAAMHFSVMDGIFTTINLPDNLGIGASHFYAEVLRVKKVATELHRGKSLFIVFDELFRGTNVKDAHEATVAIARAFNRKKTSLFIISSHIVEAGEELRTQTNAAFLYLPTRMNGHTPEYTYTLEKGITDDRHGMIIIRNEGILDILKKRAL